MGEHGNTRCCGYKTNFQVASADFPVPKMCILINVYRGFEAPTERGHKPPFRGQNVVKTGPRPGPPSEHPSLHRFFPPDFPRDGHPSASVTAVNPFENGTATAKFTIVKQPPKTSKNGAFTLIELLAVTAIIGVLAALLLTAIAKAPQRARLLACSSNLRQMGLAFHVFAHEHGGRFPQAVPRAEGGASEWNRSSPGFASIYVFNPQVFRSMSNELGSVRILVCPAASHTPAADFNRLGFTNISYLTGVAASLEAPMSALGLDNNLSPTRSRRMGVVPELPGYGWTVERHGSRGNILNADGSVMLSSSKSTPLGPNPVRSPSVSSVR